jgi:hypothetical protein
VRVCGGVQTGPSGAVVVVACGAAVGTVDGERRFTRPVVVVGSGLVALGIGRGGTVVGLLAPALVDGSASDPMATTRPSAAAMLPTSVTFRAVAAACFLGAPGRGRFARRGSGVERFGIMRSEGSMGNIVAPERWRNARSW